jgi:hypothetical protein
VQTDSELSPDYRYRANIQAVGENLDPAEAGAKARDDNDAA